MWYKLVKESQIGTQQPSLFFDPWAEGAEIKDQDGKVKKLFHGTFNDFDHFKPQSSPDNWFGGNVVYTTDSLSDVNENYATETGPDLTNKIDTISERIVSRLENDSEYAKQVGINPTDYSNANALYEAVKPLVTEQLGLKYPKVLPLYGKMKNPAIVMPNQPKTHYPGEWDEEDNYTPGNADDIFQEITDLAYEFGLDKKYINEYNAQLQDKLNLYDGFNAYDLDQAIRKSGFFTSIEDEEGNFVGGDFIKQLFQRLGHDGIIMDAHKTFKGMGGLNTGDKHYIFFEPTQLKSAIGNQGTYDPNNSVITSGSNNGWYRRFVSSAEKVSFVPYEVAKYWAQQNNIKSAAHWQKTPKPWYLPVQPDKIYLGKGWVNWSEFLGTQNQQYGQHMKRENRERKWATYEEAKAWARANRIYSSDMWARTPRPKNIPSNPYLFYKNHGWTSWHDFLADRWLTYQEAKNYVRKLGLKSVEEWVAFTKSPKFPEFLPKSPRSFYGEECESLPEFLGYTPPSWPRNPSKMLPYEEAKTWAQSNNFKSSTDYERAIKPKGIPQAPHHTYKNEWTNWYDFLGKNTTAESSGWYKLAQTRELIIMRGVPGSGKSSKAQELSKGGVVYSTDDLFTNEQGEYVFDIKKLGYNHEQNQRRAEQAMLHGVSPIVIDNTNITIKDVRPYWDLAQKYGYSVRFEESSAPWRFNPVELAQRNTHGVTQERIQKMLDKYQPTEYIQNMLDGSASAA